MLDQIQFLFNKEVFDSFLTFEVKADVDYFEGDWTCTPLFVGDLCNFSLLKESFDCVRLISILKDYRFIGANVNLFSADSVVLPHTDKDLIDTKAVTRAFIPLEEDYSFEFSGLIFKDGAIVKVDNQVFTNEIVFFSPIANHSYKNLSGKNQYFLIGDLARPENLTKHFWENYISFCVKHYI